MRQTVLYIAMSLDGYIADRNGGVEWLTGQDGGADAGDSYTEFTKEIDTVVMGWNTYHQVTTELAPGEWVYEEFTSYIFTHREPDSMEKIRFVKESPGEFIRSLKRQDGKDIWICGGADIVQQLMSDLFDWMEEAKNSVRPLILGSVFHYEFVFIHPFTDGNGRMARLWHSVILSKWKPIFEYIPIESQIEKFQEQYYDAIAKCYVDGESTAFIEFMLEQIDRILDDISVQISEDNEQLTEYIKRLLSVMDYDIPYTGKTLMEKLGLKSREGFRRNYLRPAIDMNLIRMTIPDKPNSRNQRYVKI